MLAITLVAIAETFEALKDTVVTLDGAAIGKAPNPTGVLYTTDKS